MDLSILRAVPYVVARVMGRWLMAFSIAGLRLAAGNFNIVINGDDRGLNTHHATAIDAQRETFCLTTVSRWNAAW